jgi:Spy/CpxP family protein refolding chaperone
MKRAFALVAAAALAGGAFALLAVVAAAHTARYDSTVTIHFQSDHGKHGTFKGKVVSQKTRCQIRRTVAVRKRVDGPDPLIGTDMTNKDGQWELEARGTPGAYYARARRKVLRKSADHLHVCKPAISDGLVIPKGKP